MPTMHSPSCIPCRPLSRRAGFLLLEVMLAVAIFSLAVIALGRCMGECLETQAAVGRQERAVLALQNRMIEIQASPVMPDEFAKHALKGMFSGMTMIERRRTLNIQNETTPTLPTCRKFPCRRNGLVRAARRRPAR